MALTLNSKIGDLVLAIGELIVASDGKTTTVELEIPDQDFYLEIAVKLKGEETKMEPIEPFIREMIEDEDVIFNKDSEYHKQKKKEKKNPVFKRNKPKQGGRR
jgi:hypothetical protein|nr:MAG TPA: hypothetical protein [Caudoviricetes sp.]